MLNIENPAFQELVSIAAADPSRLELFHPRTRDKPIAVFRDRESGLLTLERYERPEEYYKSQKPRDRDQSMLYSITELETGVSVKTRTLDDQRRRFQQFQDRLVGKAVCDFGAGFGGFLQLAATVATTCSGVELRDHCRTFANTHFPSIPYVAKVDDLEGKFDVITLFHVLEHLPGALETLKRLRERLRPGGCLVIEVPHAKDFLLQSVEISEFRDFSFWSEHLILHTRDTLHCLLAAAGFTAIEVKFYQRYGFTNHLNWFLNRAPGGHETLRHLGDPFLEDQYREARERDGTSDTLIAEAWI